MAQMTKGYAKRQALRVLMLAGITLAITQAIQAMGFIGVKRFTWPGLAFIVIGLAVALACFAQLQAYYRDENPARPDPRPKDREGQRAD